jgi:predicted esterase
MPFLWIKVGVIERPNLIIDPTGSDPEGILDSAGIIHEFFENEVADGISRDRIVLCGFSQGAAMAMYAGSTYSHQLGGILVMSGYVALESLFLKNFNENTKKTSLLICHGTADDVVTLDRGKKGYALMEKLRNGNSDIDFKIYEGLRHSSSDREMHDVIEWLSLRLK